MGISSAIMGVNYNTSGIDRADSINPQIEVQDLGQIRSRVENRVRRAAHLPSATTARHVLQQAQRAGKAEGHALTVSKLAQQKQRETGALISLLRTATTHKKYMMGATEQIQGLLAEHAQAGMGHQLNMGIQQQQHKGYYDSVVGGAFDFIS